MADQFTGKNPFKIPRPIRMPGGFNEETLAGHKTLTYRDSQFQVLNADGAGREITLPVAGAKAGAFFWISNKTATAHALTILQPDGLTTVCTIAQNKAALVFAVDDAAAAGTGWSLFAMFTITI